MDRKPNQNFSISNKSIFLIDPYQEFSQRGAKSHKKPRNRTVLVVPYVVVFN